MISVERDAVSLMQIRTDALHPDASECGTSDYEGGKLQSEVDLQHKVRFSGLRIAK